MSGVILSAPSPTGLLRPLSQAINDVEPQMSKPGEEDVLHKAEPPCSLLDPEPKKNGACLSHFPTTVNKSSAKGISSPHNSHAEEQKLGKGTVLSPVSLSKEGMGSGTETLVSYAHARKCNTNAFK